MNGWFETVSSAVLQYNRAPLFVLGALFALTVVLTVMFAAREIGHDRK